MSPLVVEQELELEREREREQKLERKLKLPGGTFVRGAYAHSPQVQCVYTPCRLSVPTIA